MWCWDGGGPVKRRETGMESRMKESYGEGLASHAGPELCGGVREDAAEALAGVHAGMVLSSEIKDSACRPRPDRGKAI